MMPAPGDEADHGGGGEERAEGQVPGQDADERERDRQQDGQGHGEGLEPADDEDGDEDEDDRESDPQVAEHLVGDLPFAVPFERGPVGGLRRLRRRGARPSSRSAGRRASIFSVEGGEGVDGALARARKVAEHVDHRLQVLVDDGLRLGCRVHARELAERDSARPDWESTRSESRRARLARSAAERRTRTGTGSRGGGRVEAGHVAAGARPGQRLHGRGRGDALRGRPSRGRARGRVRGSRRLQRRVDVHHALGRLEEARARVRRAPREPRPSARRSRPRAYRAPAGRAGSRPPSRARRGVVAISTSAGRTRLARSWLCTLRSCLPTRFTWRSAPAGERRRK